MKEYWRIFGLLMRKNMIVRKKHWRMTLFVEITIPLLLFLFGQVVRILSGTESTRILANTYHQIEYPDTFESPLESFALRYAPKNNLTDGIMNRTRSCMGISAAQISGSPSEDEMLGDFIKIQSEFPYTECMGIVFETIENLTIPKDFKYKVRTSKYLPMDIYEDKENGNGARMAFNGHFVRAQMCLDKAYIEKAAGKSSKQLNISIQQMPYPPYIYIDQATREAGHAFAELARLAFLVILCVEVTYPTNEKFIGINILMSVNGVKNHQNLFSWLISAILFSILYLVPIVIMLKYFLPPHVEPYLTYGNSFIIWIVLTVHACHVIAFGMHLTAYLWKPSHAVFAAFLFITLMNIINEYSTGAAIRHFLIYLGIFSPNFLLARIFDEINSYEARLIGIQWGNIFSTGNVLAPGESCIAVLILFSLLGAIIHFFLAVYLYAVRPGKYGVAQNPFFFLQKSNRISQDIDLTSIDYNREDQREFEKVPDGALEAGIQIRDLKKSYVANWFRGTKVEALRGINVDFYKGQITALLGHNGAGKTTMMSILSGLTSSTQGMVFVNGQNVQYALNAVRRNLGLCPQENMVFPDLTVHEQVLFFGMLKAKDKTRKQLEDEVDVLLGKVNLLDKKNSIARELSGGQKRRMCLAMAVIGDASVLILDEPTSGMDAESKREVWDIILKLRGEKTILISTHDMEEADILGDRVAIIHSGRMRSYGTSMFLKKLYGDGQVEVTLSIEPTCEPQKIINEIGLDAQLLSEDEGQAVLAVPLADNLPEALDRLEKEKKKLGVTGFSVSVITLEQIFLRVTREEGDTTDSSDQAAKTFFKLTGFNYFAQTTFAYLVKKFAFTRKNPWNFLISVLLPCLSVVILILSNSSLSSKPKPIDMTLGAYSNPRTFSYSDNTIYNEMYEKSGRVYGAISQEVMMNSSVTEALLKVALDDVSTYRNKYIVSAEFNTTSVGVVHANGFYSGTAIFGIPATLNMLANTILKVQTGSDDYRITYTAQYLPDSVASRKTNPGDAFTFTLALLVFLAPAVAMYVTQPLSENLSGVKQLQSMTGASSVSYWGAIYIFDLFQYIISMVLLISAFIITDISLDTRYYRGTEIMIFFLILFMLGASVLPLIYLVSFMRKSINMSTNLLCLCPIILSFIDFLLFPLKASVDSAIFDAFRAVQSKIFLLFPHISFVYGHISFFTAVIENARCRKFTNRMLEIACQTPFEPCCEQECHNGRCEKQISYFDFDLGWDDFTNLKQSLVWMTCSAIFFFALVFLFEQKVFLRIFMGSRSNGETDANATMDELVRKEAHVVSTEIAKLTSKNAKLTDSRNIFLVHELRKNYGNLEVVRGISFRVKHGECFGLLGVNGAGKSTTFRMLTGEEMPRSGVMYLDQYSLRVNRTQYLGRMGYCPQHDAIIDTLNAWEHLYLFARLRGIPRNEVKVAVEKWVQKLNLTVCASQPSGTYSGGNKRRLNIAMALIGNPSLVLMDEPTTGVDPAARRSLWNTLKLCQQGGQSIILTSHSMEECEALCNRLVIMVKGQLVCVGASQELKQRFGAGYNIHIKLNPGREVEDADRIKRRIETTLVCKLSDENSGFIGYHVTDPDATWTIMYAMMRELKSEYPCIEDFAVLSSTLEQLFIQFARAPGDDERDNSGEGVKKRRWWKKNRRASPV